jgi:hypothetical protein
MDTAPVVSAAMSGLLPKLHRVVLAVAVTVVAAGSVASPSFASRDHPSAAVDEQRIQFDPGTNNATREGNVGDGLTDRWTLTARAGQTFAITIDSADNNTVFSVFAPGWNRLANVAATQAEANTFWTGVLPANGDYVVEVTSTGGAAYYQLKVWIDAVNMDPLGLVQRISFEPGTSSGSGLGSVIRASTDSWLLTAGAGQTMDVRVVASGGGVTFDVFGPDGTMLTAPDIRTTWSGVLPVAGDYRVAVSPLAGNTSYEVIVSIVGGAGGAVIGDGPYEPDPDVVNPNPDPIVLGGSGVVQRLSFEPGADHAIVSNALAAGQADTFILGAGAGQQLNAWVESDTGDVTVSAFSPDGEVLREAGVDIYVEQLSTSGDYEIVVWNQSTIVSAYTLTVYITG